MCKRAKAARNTYNGLLQLLPVSKKPWVNVTMDFVTGLPKCHAYSQIFDAILMVIDRLLKEHYYILCNEENKRTSAKATAKLIMQHVWSREGLPVSMMSSFYKLCDVINNNHDKLCWLKFIAQTII